MTMKFSPPLLRCCLLVAPAFVSFAALAEPWEVVVRDRERQVEIDRSSIIASDAGSKVGWGRIVLSPERAALEGYAVVKALNRFDCLNRRFQTVKRVYVDARQFVLREEAVLDQRPISVARNSVDERLWQEVCRPASISELQKVAHDAVASAAAVIDDSPIGTPARLAAIAIQPPPVASLKASPRTAPSAAASTAPEPKPEPQPKPELQPEPQPEPQPKPKPEPQPVLNSRAAPAYRSPVTLTAPAAGVSFVSDAAWSYEGATGPEHWGRLRPDWSLCAEGRRQSPIELRGGVVVDLEALRFDYRETQFRITDTGRTLEVRVGEGMGVEIRGQRYELEHLEFHRPSLARVGGQASDMTVHFHHRDAAGRIAIVAVLLEGLSDGHPLIQTLWNSLPLERGSSYAPASPIDLASLVPARPAHYLYTGSLVTPPCTEGVVWAVMKEPVKISAEQVGVFARLYPRNGRPIQPLNGRLVLESR